MTRINSKSEPNEDFEAEILRKFHLEPPEVIEWAFGAWRDDWQFFPAISQIRSLIDQWHREKREAAAIEAKRREKEAVEQARKDGKLLDFADVVQQMNRIIEATPEPEHLKREREFRQRMQRASLAVGTLHLSEEEIQARRERERAECREYRERCE